MILKKCKHKATSMKTKEIRKKWRKCSDIKNIEYLTYK